MTDKQISNLAIEMMLLSAELCSRGDFEKVKGKSLAVSALHSLYVNMIKKFLRGE